MEAYDGNTHWKAVARHPVSIQFVVHGREWYRSTFDVVEYSWSKPGFMDRAIDGEIKEALNTVMFDYQRYVSVAVAY